MSSRHQLQIAPAAQTGGVLSPEQKRFNTLIAQIGEQRRALAAWRVQIPLYQQAHVKRLEPLLERLRGARRRALFTLDALLDEPGWNKAEVQTLRELLLHRLDNLIAAQPDEPAAELKALHDKHAEVDFDTGQSQSLQAARELFEAMTGIAPGNAGEEPESEEALLERIRRELADREAEEQARSAPRGADPKRRQSAAEKRREGEALQATQSVREVFRKLASALHPDREPDATRRAAKTDLMQRVNAAYATNDLLTLLELQLETEQIDAQHLQGASAARIKQYNKLLAGQLAELKTEVDRVQLKFEMDFGIDVGRKLNPDKLDRLLDQGYQELSALLEEDQRESRVLADRASTRRWLKIVKRQLRALNDDFF